MNKTNRLILILLALCWTSCDSSNSKSSDLASPGIQSSPVNSPAPIPSSTPTPVPSSTPTPVPSSTPTPTPSPSLSPAASPFAASTSCPDTSSEPIQNLTIYNGSGGIWINSGNDPYLMLGDNPSFTLEYSNISFVYDVTITASQFIFNSLNEVITPGCSDGWGPGLLAPFGIVMQRPCAQDLVFTPFEASYSVSCVDSSLGGGLLLNLNLGSDTVSFWTDQ